MFFEDNEYRILLEALRKEKELCKKIDNEMTGKIKLLNIITSIEKKIHYIQYELENSITFNKQDQVDDVLSYLAKRFLEVK